MIPVAVGNSVDLCPPTTINAPHFVHKLQLFPKYYTSTLKVVICSALDLPVLTPPQSFQIRITSVLVTCLTSPAFSYPCKLFHSAHTYHGVFPYILDIFLHCFLLPWAENTSTMYFLHLPPQLKPLALANFSSTHALIFIFQHISSPHSSCPQTLDSDIVIWTFIFPLSPPKFDLKVHHHHTSTTFPINILP
jgi:hypothetical protein